MNVINLQDVSKTFKRKNVIKPTTFAIEEKKIFGLLGPSGCGKTTLIKLIVGMLKADSGDITVLGKQVPNASLLREIGYMAQSDALYTALTGEQNLEFFAKLFGFSKSERKERIQYAANIVQLTEDLKVSVSSYSGGMKRRLSLAIALIQNPKILILDEPTVGIDPLLKRSIWNELERLKDEEDKTIIITTHIMDEAEKCDYLAMMRDGEIIATGKPTELKAHYNAQNFDDVFLKIGGGL
ncbi:ABC transporter ATP-binding protein [Ureibacillus acetophenoni]|uniref:ABC-2 type transport system ATP-binding protein n=1 Tax=Ureibacillus acetophenoni TaxID=614649 RepID=A0A285UKR1_9BACL|nr:ABC transporter ATP-binding protein [Ureibacillus acetophenoni]SOC42402.1 ABC-2 type transport system ATP-binding protein [Ureibacillus acetophenoni]